MLLQISFYNGKRTGIYESFNLREFQNAQEVEGTSSRQPEGEGSRVSLVAEGKNFRCSGAAGLHFKEEEYEILNNYVNKVRPMFNPKTEQVFCRASGERSTGDAGDINKMNNSGFTPPPRPHRRPQRAQRQEGDGHWSTRRGWASPPS